jgi:hypothetical protein
MEVLVTVIWDIMMTIILTKIVLNVIKNVFSAKTAILVIFVMDKIEIRAMIVSVIKIVI